MSQGSIHSIIEDGLKQIIMGIRNCSGEKSWGFLVPDSMETETTKESEKMHRMKTGG